LILAQRFQTADLRHFPPLLFLLGDVRCRFSLTFRQSHVYPSSYQPFTGTRVFFFAKSIATAPSRVCDPSPPPSLFPECYGLHFRAPFFLPPGARRTTSSRGGCVRQHLLVDSQSPLLQMVRRTFFFLPFLRSVPPSNLLVVSYAVSLSPFSFLSFFSPPCSSPASVLFLPWPLFHSKPGETSRSQQAYHPLFSGFSPFSPDQRGVPVPSSFFPFYIREKPGELPILSLLKKCFAALASLPFFFSPLYIAASISPLLRAPGKQLSTPISCPLPVIPTAAHRYSFLFFPSLPFFSQVAGRQSEGLFSPSLSVTKFPFPSSARHW